MSKRPNVLFLLSDEHSFRLVGRDCRDPDRPRLYEEIETPALDRLARGGTVFTDAYCQMPLCTPSRISLLTGREPRRAGAWENESVLRPDLPTVASAFSDAGYRTALIGKMHLGGRNQLAGFHDRPYGDLTGRTGHQWEAIQDESRTEMRQRTAGAGVTGIPESLLQEQVTAQESVAWIREQEAAGNSWLALASFSRPHFPLTAPRRWIDFYRNAGVEPPRFGPGGEAYDHPMSIGMRNGFQSDAISEAEQNAARAAYFACVSYLDEVIGDLIVRLEQSGALDNTIIVYTSDHGEMAGEHGVWWKNGWYEACTRVPLIVSRPEDRSAGASPGPRRCTTPVGLLDLVPTLATRCEIAPPSDLDGRDLGAALEGEQLEAVPIACDALTPRWGSGTEFRAVRYRSCKYVRFRDAPPLAFDLETDPGESRNLLARGTEEMDERVRVDLGVARNHADTSMDFDAAQDERENRDGELKSLYRLPIDRGSGNFYIFPDGALVNSDDAMLYDRRVVAADAADIFTHPHPES